MTRREPIKDAAEARSDLNIFYGVIAILEGGTLSAESYADAERIIGICKRAGGKSLRRYDAALARDAARLHGATVHPRVAKLRRRDGEQVPQGDPK